MCDVVIFIVFVMRIVGGVPLWVACVSCKYCVFMSVVHRVANLNAVSCVICSLLMFVSDASGHHGANVLEYGSCYGFVCCEDRFRLFPPCCLGECFEHLYLLSCVLLLL